MPRHLLALAALFAVGCTSSATHVQASPTTRPAPVTASGAGTTPTSTPSGSPTPNQPLVKVAFSCRLPVVTSETGGDGITYQGGFITFPAGTYADDPSGLMISAYPEGWLMTRRSPSLRGVLTELASPFFDAAAGRWIPSGAGQASPDGSSYAYATAPDSAHIQIHVVDVARATEKTFPVTLPSDVGAATGIEVKDYDGAGVYFVVDQFESYPVGTWRLDVRSGAVARLAHVADVLAVKGGFVWAGDVDPHDPNPPRVAASRVLFDSIAQVQIATGVSTAWYYTPGRSESLLGLATAGWPIVNVSDAPDYPPYGGEVRLVPEPHTDGESNGELVSNGQVLSNPETDGERTWFGSDSGVFLYTSGGGLQKVFAFAPDATTGKTMSPAGFCR